MGWLRVLASRFAALFRKEKLDQELDDELRGHLEMLIEENLRKGMTPQEARYAAVRSFGGFEQVKETYREQRGLRTIETFFQDLRYGLRMLSKNPRFTAVAVITLALGIGANTAIFSILNAVLARPLPYRDPDRIVMVAETIRNWSNTSVAPANFIDWQKQNTVFEEMAAYVGDDYALEGAREATGLHGLRVSSTFFPILGVRPAMGRSFLPEEDKPGAERVVVLSHALWERRFGADHGVLGRKLVLNGKSYTVIGVMSESFRFLFDYFFGCQDVDLWLPYPFEGNLAPRRDVRPFYVVARLKPGISIRQAQAEMDAVGRRLEQAYPESNKGRRVNVSRLQDRLLDSLTRNGVDIKRPLALLMAAAGLVLLIACVNVSCLVLVRGVGRQREMAVRAAIGGGRLRLVRQLVTEGLLLAMLGAGLGILVAHGSPRLLITLTPTRVPRMDEANVDHRVLAFALLLTALSTLLFGLAPALAASRPDLNRALKEGGVQATQGGSQQRLRSLMVAGQIAIALVLMIGAGLMADSLLNLERVNLGFDPNDVLATEISLPRWKFADPPGEGKGGTIWGSKPWTIRPGVTNFVERVLERLQQLPGVQSAAVVQFLPMGSGIWRFPFEIAGRAPLEEKQRPWAQYKPVTSDYFKTMRIRLLEGRLFTPSESMTASGLVVINATLARQFFPQGSALGQHIKIEDYTADKPAILEVIGVVADVSIFWGEAKPPDTLYMTYNQLSRTCPWWATWGALHLSFVVRTASDPALVGGAVRKVIGEVDRDVPIEKMRTMPEFLAAQSFITKREGGYYMSLAGQRFYSLSIMALAGLGVLLAAVGIYGVVAFSVSQRTHEIGIRLALGADKADIYKMVVGQGAVLALCGIGVGLASALSLTRYLASFLYGLSPTDLTTFAVATLVVLAVALLASLLPARRATRVNPMVALRYE